MRKWILFSSIGALLFLAAIPFLLSSPLKRSFVHILEKRLGASLQIQTIHLSWFGPQKFEQITYKTEDLNGTVEEFRSFVPFWSLSSMSSHFELKGGTAETASASIQQVQTVVKGASIQATGITRDQHQTGEFSIRGTAQQSNVDLTIAATRMPALVVDRLLHAKGLFAAAVGSTFELKANVHVQEEAGTFQIGLSSDSAQAVVQARFDAHAITLLKPLTASFQITPLLSEALLRNANPLFLTGIQSRSPATLTISPENFSFPRSFSLSKLQIGHATLDLGQTRIQNGPSLTSLIRLLKSDRLSNSREINAWFTPLDFSLKNGLLTTERMDLLLADSVHLCTWGSIDIGDDRIDMILGIPADTLSSAFGLRNLPSSYVLKVQVRGPTENPEFVTGPAAAKIAALLATQTIPVKKGPLGGILGIVGNAAASDGDAPPPKRPFPWEK
jgi:hypothetical protein